MNIMRLSFSLPILTAAVILIAGCGGGGGSSTPSDRNGHDYWTVLVFMAADNNLETYAIQDLNELESMGSTPEVTVLAQLDRAVGNDTSNGDWTDTRRFVVSRDSNANVISSSSTSIGEQDMGSPNALHDFIAWGMQNYPADHYLLVMWDHGRGWRSRALTTQPRVVRAISTDDTSHSEMSLEEVTEALGQTPKVDILLMDACLMQMIEVATAVKDGASFMVASEDNILATGQAYGRVLNRLTSNPSMSPETFSTAIVSEYANEYGSTDGNFTLSALRLDSLDALISATDQLSSAILTDMGSVRNAVRSARAQTQHFDFDNYDYTDYRDLYHFAQLLDSVPSVPVHSAASSVRTAADQVVAAQWKRGAQMQNSHGISIYLPAPGDTYLLGDYRELQFSSLTNWDEFLAAY